MSLVVDAEGNPAPRLIDAPLTAERAGELYRDLRTQVVRMLEVDIIHGDLSPYNVLCAAAGPTIIDFPQTIAAAKNSRSEFFFVRDLENLRKHFAGFDPRLNGCSGDAHEIWRAYVRRELTGDFVPSGRVHEPQRQGPPRRKHRPHAPPAAGAPASSARSPVPAPSHKPRNAAPPPSNGRRADPRPGKRPVPANGPVVVHVSRVAAGAPPHAGTRPGGQAAPPVAGAARPSHPHPQRHRRRGPR